MDRLLRNQTSLIDSTINIIKNNQLDVQAQFDDIGNQLHHIKVEQRILMLSVQMLIVTSNVQRIHSSIMDVLIDSHHDKINPLLLTPQQLAEEVKKIRAHLPAHLQLPIHQNNLLEVYKLIKVNGIIAKNHVIFTIELPLTDPREFQLLHIVPIVSTLNKTLTIVETSTKFLAVSLYRDEFFPMSQHEVDTCWSLCDDELICPNIPTTYQATRHPIINKCEIDLLNDQPEPRCSFHKREDTTIWQHLYRPNQYMFSTTDIIKLNAVCGNDIIPISLEGSGLITLQADCVIKNDLITIQGRQQIVTSLQASTTSFNPVIGWTKQYASTNYSANQFKPTIHELELVQQGLAQISNATFPATEVNPSTHGIIVGYAAIALVLAIAIIMSYKYKGLKTNFEPTPISRQQTTEC